MTIQELTNVHQLISLYDTRQIDAKSYITQMNKIGGFNHNACNTCNAFNDKLHSDFQIWFWNKVAEFAPSYLVKVPTFNNKDLNTRYYQTQIPLWSLKICKANIDKLQSEAQRNFRNRELVASIYEDIAALNQIMIAKKTFAESDDCINDADIERFKEAGWTNAQIGERLGVSAEAVRKKRDKLNAGPKDNAADEPKPKSKRSKSKSSEVSEDSDSGSKS